jgi:pSer/pThr/pTyr-binding forkhead associated (FHA) protein
MELYKESNFVNKRHLILIKYNDENWLFNIDKNSTYYCKCGLYIQKQLYVDKKILKLGKCYINKSKYNNDINFFKVILKNKKNTTNAKLHLDTYHYKVIKNILLSG